MSRVIFSPSAAGREQRDEWEWYNILRSLEEASNGSSNSSSSNDPTNCRKMNTINPSISSKETSLIGRGENLLNAPTDDDLLASGLEECERLLSEFGKEDQQTLQNAQPSFPNQASLSSTNPFLSPDRSDARFPEPEMVPGALMRPESSTQQPYDMVLENRNPINLQPQRLASMEKAPSSLPPAAPPPVPPRSPMRTQAPNSLLDLFKYTTDAPPFPAPSTLPNVPSRPPIVPSSMHQSNSDDEPPPLPPRSPTQNPRRPSLSSSSSRFNTNASNQEIYHHLHSDFVSMLRAHAPLPENPKSSDESLLYNHLREHARESSSNEVFLRNVSAPPLSIRRTPPPPFSQPTSALPYSSYSPQIHDEPYVLVQDTPLPPPNSHTHVTSSANIDLGGPMGSHPQIHTTAPSPKSSPNLSATNRGRLIRDSSLGAILPSESPPPNPLTSSQLIKPLPSSMETWAKHAGEQDVEYAHIVTPEMLSDVSQSGIRVTRHSAAQRKAPPLPSTPAPFDDVEYVDLHFKPKLNKKLSVKDVMYEELDESSDSFLLNRYQEAEFGSMVLQIKADYYGMESISLPEGDPVDLLTAFALNCKDACPVPSPLSVVLRHKYVLFLEEKNGNILNIIPLESIVDAKPVRSDLFHVYIVAFNVEQGSLYLHSFRCHAPSTKFIEALLNLLKKNKDVGPAVENTQLLLPPPDLPIRSASFSSQPSLRDESYAGVDSFLPPRRETNPVPSSLGGGLQRPKSYLSGFFVGSASITWPHATPFNGSKMIEESLAQIFDRKNLNNAHVQFCFSPKKDVLQLQHQVDGKILRTIEMSSVRYVGVLAIDPRHGTFGIVALSTLPPSPLFIRRDSSLSSVPSDGAQPVPAARYTCYIFKKSLTDLRALFSHIGLVLKGQRNYTAVVDFDQIPPSVLPATVSQNVPSSLFSDPSPRLRSFSDVTHRGESNT